MPNSRTKHRDEGVTEEPFLDECTEMPLGFSRDLNPRTGP